MGMGFLRDSKLVRPLSGEVANYEYDENEKNILDTLREGVDDGETCEVNECPCRHRHLVRVL